MKVHEKNIFIWWRSCFQWNRCSQYSNGEVSHSFISHWDGCQWYHDIVIPQSQADIIALLLFLFSNFNFKICPQRKTLSASVASYAINCSVCVVGFPQLSLLQENGTDRQTHWHTVINACRKGCVHLTNWTVCSTVYTVQLSWNVKSWITHLVYFVITPQKVEFGYNIPKERTAVLCCIHFSPRPL